MAMDVERRASDVLLSRLSRRTTGGRLIPEIDGLRFLAIALVLVDHAAIALRVGTGRSFGIAPFGPVSPSTRPDRFFTVFEHGSVGVLVFFMVSGFVLALPFIRNRQAGKGPIPLWPYFRRRITRIEPPYLIVMTLLFALSALAGAWVGLGHLAASLAYMHGTYYGTHSPVNSVAWTLEIEIQFYVFVPVLALLFCTGRRTIRRSRILLIASFATACNVLGVVTSFAFLGSFIQFFLLGWLLADIYVEDWHERPRASRRGDVIGLAALVTLVVGLVFAPASLERVLGPWLVFAIGYGAFRGLTLRRMLSNRWIVTIGGMCYSIYLLHYALFMLLSGALRPLDTIPTPVALLGACVLLIPLGIVVGAGFFVLVERPCMDPSWPERLAARWTRARRIGSRSDEDVIVIPESADEVVEAVTR